MSSCQNCGKKATIGYNRYMRFFPNDRRLFCESCFDQLQKREDIVFIIALSAIFVLVVGLVLVKQFTRTKQFEERTQEIEQYYDTTDLNRDGRIDFYEETASDEMRKNFKDFGYPWKKVLGPNASGSRLSCVVNRQEVLVLSKRDGFFNLFNFPDIMEPVFNALTSPDSKSQLIRAFVTMDNEIVFLVHYYQNPPTPDFDELLAEETRKKSGTASKKPDAETTTEPKKLPDPLHVVIFLEQMSETRIENLLGLDTNDYHIEEKVLVKGPEPPQKKRKSDSAFF